MKNVVIVGKMRSGKDTLAKMMVDKYGYSEFKLSTGITEIIEKLNLQREGKKNRHAYQHIGQRIRDLDEDVWCNYTDRLIKESGKSQIVISDVRQENELEFFREQGYAVIKIVSDEVNRVQRVSESGDEVDWHDFNHETELSVDKLEYDLLIINNGTLKLLETKLDLAIRYLNDFS